MIEYLGEIEREFEHALTFLSGAQVGSNDEKIEVKNLVTHSLWAKCVNTLDKNFLFFSENLFFVDLSLSHHLGFFAKNLPFGF